MKLALSRKQRSGFSLLLVTFLLGVGFLLMTGALRWSGASTALADRHNDYYTSLAAAEAATEKAVGHISHYFQNFGAAEVDNQLINLGGLYPTTGEMAEWGNYEFRNPQGGANSTYVVKLSDEQYTTGLNWKYSGFGGYAGSYRVISNARRLASPNNVIGVRQDIQVASLPIFEFAMFYAVDMELHPFTSDFHVNGRVHCNGSIYCEPYNPSSLRNVTFADHVTASGKIVHDNHPNDPTARVFGSVTYLGERDSGVNTLNLPIGTTNTPQALHSIIEIPPAGESPTSLMGQQRYYNKADLIILVSNTNLLATSGLYNGFATTIPWSNMTAFIKTNISFTDKRENKTIRATEINIGQMNAQYSFLTSRLGREPRIIYVADTRTGGGQLAGVRLINGPTLPTNGLTVATLNPLYVQGHYNAYSGHLGTTNTSQTRRASLIADAITVLSPIWNDNNGGSSLSTRDAADTTINAAMVAGIVASGGGEYSGGVENFMRALEDWYSSSRTLTFNGSIVALFHSQIATAPWGGSDVYHPPIRKYAFDENFKDPLKLPPGTPRLRTLIRSQWTAARANSTL